GVFRAGVPFLKVDSAAAYGVFAGEDEVVGLLGAGEVDRIARELIRLRQRHHDVAVVVVEDAGPAADAGPVTARAARPPVAREQLVGEGAHDGGVGLGVD